MVLQSPVDEGAACHKHGKFEINYGLKWQGFRGTGLLSSQGEKSINFYFIRVPLTGSPIMLSIKSV